MPTPSLARWIAAATAAAALIAAAWLSGADPSPPVRAGVTLAARPAHPPSRPTSAPVPSTVPADQPTPPRFATGLERLPPSLRDTDVSGELDVDAAGDLRVTRGVRTVFDYFLSATGEESPAVIRERLGAYLRARLNARAAAQAATLLDTYVAYKDRLAQALGGTRATTVAEIRARQLSIQALRGRTFAPDVAAAFFGDDEAHDQYALGKAALLSDPTLSPEQRAARLAELQGRLPAGARDLLAPTEQVQVLDALTAAWQARQGTPAELKAMREQVVGKPAAERLERLDRENAAWDHRVARYLRQRDALRADPTLAESTRHAQVESLRQAAFDGGDRLRVETLERIHDSASAHAASSSR